MIDFRRSLALPFRRSQALRWFIETAMEKVPYIWGGKNVDTGLDCSGFVTAMMYQLSSSALDVRHSHNTTALWEELEAGSFGTLRPGDLIFYGPQTDRPVSHVMVYIGEGVVLGQAYGGSSDVDPAFSRAHGRITKCLPLKYRADLVGMRSPNYQPE